jgi:hypothetical protein
MPGGPSEFLKSLTADTLSGIVDRDIEAHEEGTADDTTLIDLVFDQYPQLGQFIEESISRLTHADELTEDQVHDLKMTAVVAVGAICRAAEIHDMPTLDNGPDS